EARDVLLRDAGFVAFAFAALDYFDAAVETVRHDVPIVQKGIFFVTDIDKSGFESVFQIAHFAFKDAADEAFLVGALDGKFFQFSFLQNRDAGFQRLGIDDDLFVGLLHRLNDALHLLDDFVGGRTDALDDALGARFFDWDRLEAGLFLYFGRDVHVRFAEV